MEEEEVELNSFSASALDGCEWSVSFKLRPLYPKVRGHDTDWRGGWVGPRTTRDPLAERKKSHQRPYREMKLSRPAHSLVSILTELPPLRSI